MTDPAVEAAQRHSNTLPDWVDGRLRGYDLVCAAREALKPIQEWHRRWDDAYALDARPEGVLVSAVLADLAKLIYPESELYETEAVT